MTAEPFMESYLLAQIHQAKHKVLLEIIEQFEGRPAIDSDAENLVLATDQGRKEWVIYRDIHVGFIEVDPSKMLVTFTPLIT